MNICSVDQKQKVEIMGRPPQTSRKTIKDNKDIAKNLNDLFASVFTERVLEWYLNERLTLSKYQR